MSFYNQNSLTINTTPLSAPNRPNALDVEVVEPPTDSISSISFSPDVNFLAVASWDNGVRIYQIMATGGGSEGKAMYQHNAPVLSVCWNKDGKVLSGGADGAGRTLDPATGQAIQIAQHDAPIKTVKWVDAPNGGVLATGSWDKTIKLWDLRQSSPVATVSLPERCHTFDVDFPTMVVGTADRGIHVYDMNNLKTPYKSSPSPLKYQTRVVKLLQRLNGSTRYAIGSVEGRVAIHYVEERKNPSDNYSFRCHRVEPGTKSQITDQNTNQQTTLIYHVNDISVHPIHGTVSTSGGDGVTHIWDIDARSRLKTFDNMDAPIISSAFNHDGSIFAYAVAYDWHKGHMGMVPGHPNKVMLHACKDEEVTKKTGLPLRR
ncbi:hypothetical protein H0H87_005935 [Tephrocybe sp. NHM501043]|nr:hypothetical protein H0H87_005935 [Tephrocybe sp. NHM501043]